MRSFWDKLKAQGRIDALGLSYAAIGRKLGYSRQAVGHWFRGRSDPTMKDLHRLAEMLGVPVMELLTEDAEIAVTEPQQDVVRLMKDVPLDQQAMVLAVVRAALKR